KREPGQNGEALEQHERQDGLLQEAVTESVINLLAGRLIREYHAEDWSMPNGDTLPGSKNLANWQTQF
ncbi:MAG TPA: hypothetical protein VKI17_09675, partial [Gemmataceae bacterium]|nr:hypothetical protein [Gemmataceae bacterium]